MAAPGRLDRRSSVRSKLRGSRAERRCQTLHLAALHQRSQPVVEALESIEANRPAGIEGVVQTEFVTEHSTGLAECLAEHGGSDRTASEWGRQAAAPWYVAYLPLASISNQWQLVGRRETKLLHSPALDSWL
jgi:hypothetical protein